MKAEHNNICQNVDVDTGNTQVSLLVLIDVKATNVRDGCCLTRTSDKNKQKMNENYKKTQEYYFRRTALAFNLQI